MKPKLFVATKAFIVYQAKVLLIRESSNYDVGVHVGKFDVVGGRITPGEHVDEAMLREIKEETGLNVKLGKPFFVNESWPVVNGEQWQIIRIFYEAEADTDQIKLSKDHDQYVWIHSKDYREYAVIENLYLAFEAYLQK
ncbi:MAG TPA: NUDIX domain-containing protein [Candidatus Nanoarchaeia archaeon]|nr:NUDIX domain-containing protein [Candidatus Nanoarchaeia archaeon]